MAVKNADNTSATNPTVVACFFVISLHFPPTCFYKHRQTVNFVDEANQSFLSNQVFVRVSFPK